MRKRASLAMGIVATAVLLVAALGGMSSAQTVHQATMDGFQEVPSISSTGTGELTVRISESEQMIRYTLKYSGLEGSVTQAHIHLGQEGVAGGVMVFLCGGGGKPACPQAGQVKGQIVPDDIIGPSAQGIDAGEFDEAVAAIEAGFTYGNVHSDKHPGGEIRGHLGTS
ncbi:MAG: CHRD domain-containing protein [Actinomycetota bacterium]